MQDVRKRVLIVDDEPGVRDSLKLLLKSNFEVGTAENGIEALAAIKDFGPDIVLLDVMMPKLDGMQTLRQLREDGFKRPVIMLNVLANDPISSSVSTLARTERSPWATCSAVLSRRVIGPVRNRARAAATTITPPVTATANRIAVRVCASMGAKKTSCGWKKATNHG